MPLLYAVTLLFVGVSQDRADGRGGPVFRRGSDHAYGLCGRVCVGAGQKNTTAESKVRLATEENVMRHEVNDEARIGMLSSNAGFKDIRIQKIPGAGMDFHVSLRP